MNLKSDESPREIIHIQNIRWEDDSAKSNDESFEDMDLLIKKIKKYRTCGKPSPIVVHCSAGIGRTGTVIAIYAIIEAIDKLHQSQDDFEKAEIDESI